jgi:hypothetical protein|tara:strand:- start:171 stop:581 length:411 start_codon:yes stop_codon:yes gene_type:complete
MRTHSIIILIAAIILGGIVVFYFINGQDSGKQIKNLERQLYAIAELYQSARKELGEANRDLSRLETELELQRGISTELEEQAREDRATLGNIRERIETGEDIIDYLIELFESGALDEHGSGGLDRSSYRVSGRLAS